MEQTTKCNILLHAHFLTRYLLKDFFRQDIILDVISVVFHGEGQHVQDTGDQGGVLGSTDVFQTFGTVCRQNNRLREAVHGVLFQGKELKLL